jgi:hypothetical protein
VVNNRVAGITPVLRMIGAGDGNRTHVRSLGMLGRETENGENVGTAARFAS